MILFSCAPKSEPSVSSKNSEKKTEQQTTQSSEVKKEDDEVSQAQPTGDSLVVYELSDAEFEDFAAAPTDYDLESAATQYEYFVDSENEGMIIEKKNSQPTSINSYEEGMIRLSYMPLEISFLEYWASKKLVGLYLQSRGVTEEVQSIVLLVPVELPSCVLVGTASERYYITINDDMDDALAESRVYRHYTEQEFSNKFKVMDGTLRINSNKVSTVKMHYDFAEIPLLSLFKQLGATVQWNDKMVTIRYNEKTLTLDLDAENVKLDKTVIEQLTEAPGGGFFFSVQDNEIYFDNTMVYRILRRFGAELSFDRKKLTVDVTVK